MFCFNVDWGCVSIVWLYFMVATQTESAVNVITHVYGHRKIRYWSGRMNQESQNTDFIPNMLTLLY